MVKVQSPPPLCIREEPQEGGPFKQNIVIHDTVGAMKSVDTQERVLAWLKTHYFADYNKQPIANIHFEITQTNEHRVDAINVYLTVDETEKDFLINNPTQFFCAMTNAMDIENEEELWKNTQDKSYRESVLSLFIFLGYLNTEGIAAAWILDDRMDNQTQGETAWVGVGHIRENTYCTSGEAENETVTGISFEQRLSSAIAHETMHLLGFKHVDVERDIMSLSMELAFRGETGKCGEVTVSPRNKLMNFYGSNRQRDDLIRHLRRSN